MQSSLYIPGTDAVERDALLDALSSLDRLLESGLILAQGVYGWDPGTTRFRGLFVAREDVERRLAHPPSAPLLMEPGTEPFHALDDYPPLNALSDRYGLEWFDRATLLIALAPEIDVRYERVYAYLQDDVARRRPSVDLILNLLTGDVDAKLSRRAHFAVNAPLLRHGLIHLLPEPPQPDSSLLTRVVKLDEQVVQELLGAPELDSRLAPFAEISSTDISLASLPLEPGQGDALRQLALRAQAEQAPLRLAFRGPAMPLKRRAAAALASDFNRPLLSFDLALAIAGEIDVTLLLRIAAHNAKLLNTVLFVDLDAATCDERLSRTLVHALAATEADVILSGNESWAPPDRLICCQMDFAPASYEVRREHWKTVLAARGIVASEEALDTVAGRFRLYPDQIETAAAAVVTRSWRRGEKRPDQADLCAAARAQSGRQIGALARKIEPNFTWEDIVLPKATTEQLRAICARVRRRHRVLDEWGFERKLSMGKGVTALFAGPSGVGKTMAAEIIARELEIELYKIDLSGVVSKYIGETEKNLEKIFAAAENANAILFFDEADALFGKRSEVRDSHDRYANIEISYLLQKMEMYDGIAILASNLRQNLDESFVRRLAFTIHFPFPDEEQRRRIWRGIWPGETPLHPALDFSFLAAQFKLSGGNIKNVALSAAFLAADEGSEVCMRHLMIAVAREYQKMSKPLSPEQMGPYAAEAES